MKYTEKISNQLNKLLEKNYDAEKGYLNAAESVENPKLKIFFKKKSTQRGLFAKDLRMEILSYGQIPEENGSLKGTIHRNWMSLKSLFSTNDEEAIIEEALRGEKASIEEYASILSQDDAFAPSTKKLLENQKQQIQSAINNLILEEELA